MACTVGNSSEIRYSPGGSISDGIIIPPRIMEGRKINWLKRTIMREFGETTPINMPILAKANIVRNNISTKYPQFVG